MVDLTIDGGSQTLDGTYTYGNVNIINGGTLYVTPYNGTGTTGRLIINATTVNVDSSSSIIGLKRGYRGGASTNCSGAFGGERQGYGGGAFSPSHGAGGGGYGTVGGNGSLGGAGGPIQGTLDGPDIQMGNGGGAAGTAWCVTVYGGEPGGAMLTINAQNINIHGTVNFNGGNGGGLGYGGGGASGGGILFDATNINLSSATITANGGAGGIGTNPSYSGGPGGAGRIKIFYSGTYNNSGATISTGGPTVYVQYNPPLTGNLSISSTPSGARIYIDNIDQGIYTPNTISDLTTGNHDVKLVITNYNDYTTMVTIDPGQTTTITPTLTLSPGMAKVQASPSFVQPSFPGEIIDIGTLKFSWNGTGTVILEKTIVYDRLVLTGPNGVFDHTWTPCGSIVPEGPFNITNIFTQGYNEINVKIYNVCGGNIGTTTGSIDITGPIILTCPITPKYSGDTITLQATPRDGIGPYYVEFSKDGLLIDPARLGGTNPGTSQIYNAPENTTITRTYTLTDEDVRNSPGTITFGVFISDSCPTTARTCTQGCIVEIGCMPPVCNFTVV